MAGEDQDIQIVPGGADPSSPAAKGTGTSTDADYENMSGWDVARRAAVAAPKSFMHQIGNLGEAIMHPVDTARAIGDVAYGAGSKLGIVGEQTPEAKARNEASANAIGRDYANRYGSWAGFAKGMSEDPFAYGMDVGAVVPGVGIGLRAAGAPGLARAANVARFVDPTQAALGIAKKTVAVAPGALGSALGIESGVPAATMRYAAEAGASTNPAMREAFQRFRSGAGDLAEISDVARASLDELKQTATTNYRQGLNTVQQAFANQPVPYTGIDRSLADARQIVNPHGQPVSEPARRTLQHVESFINGGPSELTGQNYVGWRNLPHEAQTMMGLDKLKQAIGSLRYDRMGLDPFQRKALNAVYDGIRSSIVDADNRIMANAGQNGQRISYAKAMEDWQGHLDTVNDWTKTLGLGDRTAQASRINRLLQAPQHGERAAILEAMAKTKAGQYLPYMIAGATTAASGPDVMHSILSGLMTAGMYSALPHPFAIPAAAAVAAAGSPRVVGGASYALGAAKRPVTYALDMIPSAGAVSGAVGNAGRALRAVAPNVRASDVGHLLGNVAARGAGEMNRQGVQSGRGRFDPERGASRVFDLTDGPSLQRPGRASGGGVKDAVHERLVNRLMGLANAAKKATNQTTKPLLNVDDSTIARALQTADNAI